jgi:hypothetical protein
MSVRAEWHTDLHLPELPDPFASRIEDVGVPVFLGAVGEEAKLRDDLLDTVRQEVELADAGVSCRVKGTMGTSCHVCPLYRNDASAEARLCAIGRRQEKLCTELKVIQVGGRR